jgi:predicted nucleotidyltransferase
MGIEEILGGKREAILRLADKHGAYNVRVFGSVARGEAGPASDVDFVVDVQPWVGLEFFGLWDELEDLLGREVDLVTERSLKPRIRERILREAVAL